MTVRVAALLVAVPKALVTTARNIAPLSDVATDAMVKLADVAPAMLAPLRCHWKLSGAVPVAATREGDRLADRRGSGSAAAS